MEQGRLANELLGLERQHLQGGLSMAEAERWDELIRCFIHQEQSRSEQRGHLRYPGACAVTLERDGETCRCEVLDLSLQGLRLKGDLSRHFRAGDTVTWTALQVDEHTFPVQGTLEISWKRGRWRAGVRFSDLDAMTRRQFYGRAYYPAYLKRLRTIARS